VRAAVAHVADVHEVLWGERAQRGLGWGEGGEGGGGNRCKFRNHR
jgi:hypothetical protein